MKLMSILRAILEHWKHLSLRKLRKWVLVPRSVRLLRKFSVRFMTTPQERIYVRIGERCILNVSITFESADGFVEIGDRTYMGHDTHIISRNRVSIGNDVTMAWGITIYDHNSHSLNWRQRSKVVDHVYRTYGTPNCFDELDWTDVRSAPIVIHDRAWIGFNVIILKGVTIGEGAVIGAGSVVTRDVEPYTVVGGNPAELLRRLEPQPSGAPPHANS